MLNHQSLKDFLDSQLPPALKILEHMVGINSYTANKEGVNRLARYTAKCFAPLGFTAKSVPSRNPAWGDHLVLTRKGRTSKSIAFISHLDTVFPLEEEKRNNFRWSREGNRIFGPGTHDIKGGSMMMWLLLKTLKKLAPKDFEDITWKLIWNSSEECYSPDFGDVCRRNFTKGTLAALVFESEGRNGNTGLMVLARKGRGTWRATVSGRGSHAGGKHRHGANAVVQLAHTVQSIAELTDYSRDLTVNVGTIAGGTVLNRIPHEAVAEGEFRTFKPKVFADARARLLALNGPGKVTSPADGYACEVNVKILTESRPWPRNPGTDGLYEFWKEAGEELGVPTAYEERGGLSDGNLIWDAVPTIDGLGAWGDNDHCSERSKDGSKLPEYILVNGIMPKAMVNTIAILKLCERAGRGK